MFRGRRERKRSLRVNGVGGTLEPISKFQRSHSLQPHFQVYIAQICINFYYIIFICVCI